MTPAEWEQARAYVCRRYGSQAGDEVEDLAQIACLRALLAERRGQTVSPGYVGRAAGTILIDEWRKRARRPSLSIDAWPGLVDRHRSDELRSDLETRAAVERLLAGCTPRQRRVLELYAEGCRAREIADVLSCTPNAVKRIIYRMRHGPEGRLPRTRSTAWSAGASI